MQSHPMWVRGLKQIRVIAMVWQRGSHPMWVRGLKLLTIQLCNSFIESHPMWVRGLKPNKQTKHGVTKMVAPHVGAWIETR